MVRVTATITPVAPAARRRLRRTRTPSRMREGRPDGGRGPVSWALSRSATFRSKLSMQTTPKGVIDRLHGGAELGDRPGGLALDRPPRAPEGLCRLLLGQLLEIPQHEDRPHPWWKRGQRGIQAVGLRQAQQLGIIHRLIGGPVHKLLQLGTPPPVGHDPSHCRPHIPLWIVLPPTPPPRGTSPGQGLLDEILCVMRVAGQDMGIPIERGQAVHYEILKSPGFARERRTGRLLRHRHRPPSPSRHTASPESCMDRPPAHLEPVHMLRGSGKMLNTHPNSCILLLNEKRGWRVWASERRWRGPADTRVVSCCASWPGTPGSRLVS